MSFMSELQQALFDFQNKNGKALDPDRVAKSIIKSARKNSRSWGADSKPEIPNLFTVTVGTEDWNAYYGQRPEDIAGEMAYCVMRLAHNKGLYLASDPVISFEEDAAIPRGRCRVNAQFNFNERERLRREPIEATLHEEAAAEPEQQFDPFEPRNETPAIPAQQATVIMQPVEMEQPPAQPAESLQPEQQRTVVMQPVEAVADTAAPSAAQTTVMQPAGETKVLSPVEEAMPEAPAAMTSVLQKPVIPEASLEGSGVVLRIFHDCTVGVVRKPEAEVQPDVALPYKHFPYGSHIQGKFACMDGVWHFLNVGRNGTRIQMHDQDIMLEPSMSCVIPYDAWITFAEGLPLRFVKKS